MKVTVIITSYNYGHYLPECLDSVLAQTLMPDEIIVVDDGSTDDTPDVVQQYVKNPLVTYIRTENAGVSAARNRAIRSSSGDVVAILDADDKWRADKLELQIPLFRNPKVAVVYSLCQPFNEEGLLEDYRRVPPQRGHILEALMSDNVVPLSSAVVRRDCFEKTGMFNESRKSCQDFDLWTRMSVDGVEFDYVDQPLMMYRKGHASMISDTSRHYREKQIILDELFRKEGTIKITSAMKRSAWSSFYSKRAYSHYNTGRRWNSLADATRSICHRPSGAQGLAWKLLVKNLLPRTMNSMPHNTQASSTKVSPSE